MLGSNGSKMSHNTTILEAHIAVERSFEVSELTRHYENAQERPMPSSILDIEHRVLLWH